MSKKFARHFLTIWLALAIGSIVGLFIGTLVACLTGLLPAIWFGFFGGGACGYVIGDFLSSWRGMLREVSRGMAICVALGIGWCATHIMFAIARGQIANNQIAIYLAFSVFGGALLGMCIWICGVCLKKAWTVILWIRERRRVTDSKISRSNSA